MFRLYCTRVPTLLGAAFAVICATGSAGGQTITSSMTSTVTAAHETTHLRILLDSMSARQQQRHRELREHETKRHVEVSGFTHRFETTLSASTAYALFHQSERVLTARTADLRSTLFRQKNSERPLVALREQMSSDPRLSAELEQLIEENRQIESELLVGPYHDVHHIVDSRANILAALQDRENQSFMQWSGNTRSILALELQTVAVMTRAHVHRLSYRITNLGPFVQDVGGVTVIASVLFYCSIVLFFLVWLRRQIPGVVAKLRVYEYQYARTVKRIRQIDRLVALISHFGAISINIAAVHAFAAAFNHNFNYIEIKVAFAIAYWVAYYRLAHKFFEVLIFRVARRRFRVDFQKRKRIAQSIFFLGRAVLGGGLILSVIHAVTNFGMLYYWSQKLFLVVLFIAGLILLNRWRPSIVAVYLDKGPDGKLADLVEKAKDKPYGFFLVCLAFLYVAGHGALVLIRDTVLSFEQSRKALAFFFRRRLERHAEELGQWVDEIEKLPPDLVQAFTLHPLTDESLRVDRFPGLEQFEESYQRWLNYKVKGAVLIVAPLGYGKTTWLHRATKIEGVEPLWLSLNRVSLEPTSLCSYFRTVYEFEGDDFRALVDAILQGPRCVIALDDVQCLVTRTIGGCERMESLMELIEATGHHVFWLCTMDSLSWKFLKTAQPRRAWFRDVIELSAWSDDEISQLIMARAAASGVVHCFEDLITEENDEKTDQKIAEIGESYARLIWDSSDGCPWVALHYWLRSLAPVSDHKVRVRLFRRADLTRLEKWPKEVMFLYAAIALHNRLSANEVARVLRYSKEMCESFLNQGCEEGYLVCDEDGRYHFNVNWYRPIIRYLRQRHAVEDL
jgi:hypothetical protein